MWNFPSITLGKKSLLKYLVRKDYTEQSTLFHEFIYVFIPQNDLLQSTVKATYNISTMLLMHCYRQTIRAGANEGQYKSSKISKIKCNHFIII